MQRSKYSAPPNGAGAKVAAAFSKIIITVYFIVKRQFRTAFLCLPLISGKLKSN
ncbi:hypothetical protein H9Q10_01985 [Eikenella sp. S3360]|uniref:Uncharacterized protein n=1 Tax=Eikenella glucosivorans TaxID=2766967 RepID=A0ABS0N845_9NEIS|nr:hypothetical protein [Eikenella glucosivorans]MBH5328442.1 hypothetical protein [Eikenella glucosivorans]